MNETASGVQSDLAEASYLGFFGLSELPFTLTPNTSFYFGLPPHEEAIAVVRVALAGGEGIIKITGEVGTGKTMLLRRIMNNILPQDTFICYFPNPYLSAAELREALAHELGAEKTEGMSTVTDAINHRLIELKKEGRSVVVFIDEAQALPDETLEAVRLFGNLETESSKLLQIVLFGQPELDERLARPEFRQLRQRIAFSYRLRPLTVNETDAYIASRLRAAGYRGQVLFPRRAVRKIWRASRGIPRLINILSHKCLMLAFGRGSPVVKGSDVKGAIRDTEDAWGNYMRRRATFFFMSAAIILIIIAAVIVGIAEVL